MCVQNYVQSCVLKLPCSSLDLLIPRSPLFAWGGISALTCLVSSRARVAQQLQHSDKRGLHTSSDWTHSLQHSPPIHNVHHFCSSSNHFYNQWGVSALWKEVAACSAFNLSASCWLHISSYYNHALALVWKHNFLKAGDPLIILLAWDVLWTVTDGRL